MRLTRKRGALAIIGAVTIAAAIAIPTVVAGQTAAGPGGATSVAGGPKVAATGTVSCNITKMTGAWNDAVGSITTSSTSYIPVPGMTVDFATPSTCAEITFSSWVYAINNEIMDIRVSINGTPCLSGQAGYHDSGIQFATNYTGTYGDARGYTFICAGWHPAHHNIATVEYRSFFGGSVSMHQPNMVVRYG